MLVGRDHELGAIRRALGVSRLVTLVGPGGVGKTALAEVIAGEAPSDAVLLASLEPLDGGGLAEAVSGSLGFRSFADMLAMLSSSGGLVVLDNCEHVLDEAAALVGELLAASPVVRVLATSRERLDVAGEWVVPTQPLSTVGDPSPAARMLRQAIVRRGGTNADDDPAIDELCRRLDGLPLALELAAARMSSLTAGEIVDHLSTDIGLLARTRPRGPSRHRSLSAMIEWSFDRLDDDARTMLMVMAVPPGQCDVDMAAALSGQSPAAARTLVGELVEKSLLVHEPSVDRSWYRMLETIRSFARDRATDATAEDAADRLVEHMATWADGMDVRTAMSDLTVPVTIRRSFNVLSWAIERALRRGDRSTCHRLVVPLWWLAEVGHQTEGVRLVRRVIERWPDDRSDGAETCWGVLASLLVVTADPEPATEVASRAALGSGIGAAFGERALGLVQRRRGAWQAATDHFDRSAQLATASDRPALAIEVNIHRALTLARTGDLDAAIAAMRALRSESEHYEAPHAWVLDFLAYVLLVSDPVESAALAREVLDRAERAGNSWLVASAACTLAIALLTDDQVEEAARQTVIAIEAYSAIRNQTDAVLAFRAAAAVLARLGDTAGAHSVLASEHARTDISLSAAEEQFFASLGPTTANGEVGIPLTARDVTRRLRAGLAAAESPASEGGDSRGSAHRFVLVGDSWELEFDGRVIMQRASKGLADIATLLASPGKEIAALDLMGAAVVSGDAGPLSDDTARREYQERIRDLQQTIEEAEHDADLVRAERASAELDRLVEQLSSAYGLAGRGRTHGHPAERARSAVRARIRAAITKIAESHPALADHLERNISTGRFCSYSPPESMTWQTAPARAPR